MFYFSGGNKFTNRLVAHFVDLFIEKYPQHEDIKTNKRALAKIRKKAEKIKTVLSANEEIPVFINSLYKDIDYSVHITRKTLEELCSDLFERIIVPVTEVLDAANITASDLDTIELLGGGVRIPKIQFELKRLLGVESLGAHLNGDEAMALGAAFHGANLSTAFRVRHVGMTDVSPYPVGVRLSELIPRTPEELAAELAEAEAEEKAEAEALAAEAFAESKSEAEILDSDKNISIANGENNIEQEKKKKKKKKKKKRKKNAGKQWTKRATLFKRFNRLGSRKVVSFRHTRDISCTFHYDKLKGTIGIFI